MSDDNTISITNEQFATQIATAILLQETQSELTACILLVILHFAYKLRQGNYKLTNLILLYANISWFVDCLLSYIYVRTADAHVAFALLVASLVFDVVSKLLILYFLLLKFTCMVRERNLKNFIPFIGSFVMVVAGFIAFLYLFSNNQAFDITNPLFILGTTPAISLSLLDLYLLYKIFQIKKKGSEQRKLLNKGLILCTLNSLIKLLATILFVINHDPFYFYYMVAFPVCILLYEVSNEVFVGLVKSMRPDLNRIDLNGGGNNGRAVAGIRRTGLLSSVPVYSLGGSSSSVPSGVQLQNPPVSPPVSDI